MKNEWEKDIREKLKLALKCLYDNDNELIDLSENVYIDCSSEEDKHVGERAIMFRLTHYLQNILDSDVRYSDYKVDCEYNRHMADPKELEGESVYPDIIVHQRGNDDHNLLVIEIKGYWNRNTSRDKKKLRLFTGPNATYQYSLGASCMI